MTVTAASTGTSKPTFSALLPEEVANGKGKNASISISIHAAAADALIHADHVLILAGAGFSADSGLDTYETMPEEYRELCDPIMLLQETERFQRFWLNFAEKYSSCTPHKGYAILDKWFAGGKLPRLRLQQQQQTNEHKTERKTATTVLPDIKVSGDGAPWYVYTSNVDGHFRRYESFRKRVCEIHGCASEFRCANAMGMSTGRRREGDIWNKFHNQVDASIHMRTTGNTDNTISKCNNSSLVHVGLLPHESAEEGSVRNNEDLDDNHQHIVTCQYCGLPSRPNVLMFHDTDSNVLQSINKQRDQYQQWEAQMEDDVVLNGKNLVILEFGCGMSVPAVRNESEEVFVDCLQRLHQANTLRSGIRGPHDNDIDNSPVVCSKQVTLVRVNPKDAGIDHTSGSHGDVISVYDTSLRAICSIDQCLDQILKTA